MYGDMKFFFQASAMQSFSVQKCMTRSPIIFGFNYKFATKSDRLKYVITPLLVHGQSTLDFIDGGVFLLPELPNEMNSERDEKSYSYRLYNL